MTLDTTNILPPALTAADFDSLRKTLIANGHPMDLPFHAVNSESGNIVACAYSPETKAMLVIFKNKSGPVLYSYENVEPETYGEFAMTFPDRGQSTGSYFHRVFRSQSDAYPCKKLEAKTTTG